MSTVSCSSLFGDNFERRASVKGYLMSLVTLNLPIEGDVM